MHIDQHSSRNYILLKLIEYAVRSRNNSVFRFLCPLFKRNFYQVPLEGRVSVHFLVRWPLGRKLLTICCKMHQPRQTFITTSYVHIWTSQRINRSTRVFDNFLTSLNKYTISVQLFNKQIINFHKFILK